MDQQEVSDRLRELGSRPDKCPVYLVARVKQCFQVEENNSHFSHNEDNNRDDSHETSIWT